MAEQEKAQAPDNVSKEEQIGFHKGALSTLSKEREELAKIVNICEQLMQMHVKALKDLGVDLEAQAKEAQTQGSAEETKTNKKIDELL